ncbi:MAG: hypothetical protein QOI99_896, partial [Actinomycetota bacterium]|nr:hypothetical protein [Actinomycetota bacterium]
MPDPSPGGPVANPAAAGEVSQTPPRTIPPPWSSPASAPDPVVTGGARAASAPTEGSPGSSGVPPYVPGPDREGEIASRLRALAASPGDPESLRRGLLWVAGEVQGCEQATRLATEQIAVLTDRLAALEAREQASSRATAGIDGFRREFLWLSAEVQSRGEALAKANGQIDGLIAELSVFRHQAGQRIEALEMGGGAPGDVRAALDRVAVEATGAGSFAEVARAALRTGQLEGLVRELHDELEKVTHGVLAGQQTAMAHVAGRTAPLEGALHELRRELDRVADEAATSQTVGAEVIDRVGGLEQRLKAVEALQGELDGVYRELDRLSGNLAGG